MMLALALCGLAHATDPLLEGLPGAQSVTVIRQDPQWIVTAGGRSVLIAPVQTETDKVALRALVTSLLAEVDLRELRAPDTSASRALALLRPLEPPPPKPLPEPPPAPEPEPAPPAPPPPAPAPPPEPEVIALASLPIPDLPQAPTVLALPLLPQDTTAVLTATVARWDTRRPSSWWFGPELVMRPALSPVVGPAMGWTVGERHGLEPRLAVRWARTTAYGEGTRMGELATNTSFFYTLGPLRLLQGLGVNYRRYAYGSLATASHLMLQDITGIGLHLSTPRWDLELDGVLEYDLMRTHIGWNHPDDTLPPAALRLEMRLAPSFAPRGRP
jgi:hypothetical protein